MVRSRQFINSENKIQDKSDWWSYREWLWSPAEHRIAPVQILNLFLGKSRQGAVDIDARTAPVVPYNISPQAGSEEESGA